MRVLQMLPALELGGVERGTLDLARALKSRGESAVVLSSGGSLVRDLERLGIPHPTLPIQKKSLATLALVPQVVRIIERERIEVVHARSRVPAWVGWLAARRAGIPFVTTCHGFYAPHFLSRVMGWGKKVIVPSGVIARHMIDDFKVPPDRIALIPRGVDLDEFPFSPTKYEGPPPKVHKILNLGRLSRIKGQIEFLRAIHRVKQEGVAFEVWLAGSEGEGKTSYTQEIQQTIRQLGLEKNVKLLGTRRDVASLLKEADLLVLSSLVPESFGRVLIEAGAVGTACVATRLGGALEIIEDGSDGLLVPPGDEKAMAQAIGRLLRDREEAQRMSQRMRQKVELRFSLDAMAEKTLAVYREVKEKKRILVMKLGALGDVILAGPSFRMLRKRFPQAHVSLLVDQRFISLFSNCPYLDEVLPLRREKMRSWLWLARFAKRLRGEGFDLSVDLQNSKRTHFLAFWAGIPDRYGFRRGPFGGLLNHPDLNYALLDAPVRHQFRVLSHLGISQLDERLELWPDPGAERIIRDRLSEARGQGGEETPALLVGFAIGSSPRWPTKRWPVEHFQALAHRLTQGGGCRIVLIGSDRDQALADAVVGTRERSRSILNFVGKTSLKELIALIHELDLLVTGDTAPLHIAGALGIPTVALFGPTDPHRHVGERRKTLVLTRRLPCQPCYQGTCHYEETLACLRRIEADEVFRAVQRLLEESAGPLAMTATPQ